MKRVIKIIVISLFTCFSFYYTDKVIEFSKERDPIMMPKCFDDYVLLLKEIQKTQDKTGRDINSIKYAEVLVATKINDKYKFEYFDNREEAEETYGKAVETIGIGNIIYWFKRHWGN